MRVKAGAFPFHSILWFVFSVASFAFAPNGFARDPRVSETVVLHRFEEYSFGMERKEAKAIMEIFEKNPMINLEASGLKELESWLNQVIDRFTKTAEKQGRYYPIYRIDLYASDEPNSYIYKYRPAGQSFYRGYVFVSTGLLFRFLDTLKTDWDKITPEKLEELLKGLLGVLSHDFSQPKEDEMVKWDWRESNDGSMGDHSQGDEMATDLMSIRLLKDSGFPPDASLKGLELLFGDPKKEDDEIGRSIEAMFASQPEKNIRLNVIRAALTKVRLEEGLKPQTPVSYDFRKLVSDLKATGHVPNRETELEAKAAATGRPFFELAIESSAKALEKSKRDGPYGEGSRYKGELRWLMEMYEKHPPEPGQLPLINAAWIRFSKENLTVRRDKLTPGRWYPSQSNDIPQGPLPRAPLFLDVRFAQKFFKKLPLHGTPEFEAWFKETFLGESLGEITQGDGTFEDLALFLTREQLEITYRHWMNQFSRFEPLDQTSYLLQMYYGVTSAKGSSQLELEILRALTPLLSLNPECRAYAAGFLTSAFSALNQRPYFSERIKELPKDDPTLQSALLEAYFGVIDPLFQDPKAAVSMASLFDVGWLSSGRVAQPYGNLLLWKLDPLARFKSLSMKTAFKTDVLADYFEAIYSMPQWQKEIEKSIAQGSGDLPYPNPSFINQESHVWKDNIGLSLENRVRLANALLLYPMYPKAKALETPLFVYQSRLGSILNATEELAGQLGADLIQSIKEAGRDPKEFLSELSGKPFNFKNELPNGKMIARIGFELKRRGVYTVDELHRLLGEDILFVPEEGEKTPNPRVTEISRDETYALWRLYRSEGKTPIEFVQKILDANRIDHLELDDSFNPWDQFGNLREAQRYGIKYNPAYATQLTVVEEGLENDLRREHGLLDLSIDSAAYLERFRSGFPRIQALFQQIFNPDHITLAIERKGAVDFRAFDPLLKRFSELVPPGLDWRDQYTLWKSIVAKRANRYTDRLFLGRIEAEILKLPIEEQRREMTFLLSNGLIRSERKKIEYLRVILGPEIEELKTKKGSVTDREIYGLIKKTSYFVLNTSRFRDEFIEDLAWGLELSENQTSTFIEPMKSFNYRTMDPMTMNLFSGVSVWMSKLSNSEKLAFIDYVKEPKGELTSVFPTLVKAFERFDQGMNQGEQKAADLVDRLEGFIRDANEDERLTLNEMIIGTRGVGLWWQGDKMREELFKRAGLEPGSKKQVLFENYIKVLPYYETTITLSYLIASLGSEEKSELLRILEMFQAPGIKFAQMASVLGIFGPERSDELAKAKNQATPPSRAEVYRILKERYNELELAEIKSVKRRLGSGSLKYVVLVEFKDGKREAVYLRRPHLDDTIETTLKMAEAWMKELQNDPRFKDSYDYDYYLGQLRSQLALEVQFKRELELSGKMAEAYSKVPTYEGWSFVPVPVSEGKKQNEWILHFQAVEGATEFKDLPPDAQKTVSEYILDTELELLFKRGTFDADRHLGNYLFDLKNKQIRPVDMGQAYFLKPNGFFKPGDPFQIARLIYGLTHEDPKTGAELLVETFQEISVEGSTVDEKTKAKLMSKFNEILNEKTEMKTKLLKILSELNTERVRIQMTYSLGVIKGLMILLNEDYAKKVEPSFIKSRVEKFIRRQMLIGKWYGLVSQVQSFCDFSLKRISK